MVRSILLAIVAALSMPAADFTVRLYNDSGAKQALLTAAVEDAARVFQKTGLTPHWRFCSVEDCEAGPADLVIHVVTRPGTKLRGSTDLLGQAIGGKYAAVFLQRACELAVPAGLPISMVLAAAMVHELGHLLLGAQSHSPSGIMRATWTRIELYAFRRGDLNFSSDQARRIAGRVQSPGASLFNPSM